MVQTGICLLNYSDCRVPAAAPDELSMKQSDVVVLIQRIDADWYCGYLYSDPVEAEGIFPTSFVDVCCSFKFLNVLTVPCR